MKSENKVDHYIFVREPWESTYSCHVVCDGHPRKSEVQALRRRKGRSVRVTDNANPEWAGE